MKSKAKKEVYEFQWLQPTKNKGTKTVYESTFDYFTEAEAKKKGFFHCIEETKRLRIKNPPLLKSLEDLIHICQVNLEQFEAVTEKENYKDKESSFSDLVQPHFDAMMVKYKMKRTNRQYAFYSNKRQELKVLPPNDILNKDNKQVSLWLNIIWKSRYSISSELRTYDKLKLLIKILEEHKQLFFTTTQEQRDRILALDPKAVFPKNEMVQTTLDYYDMQAALLNTKNKLRGTSVHYPNPEDHKVKEKVVIKPEELSFIRAHGHSMCMIRYKGLYYGYYTSGYVMDHRDKDKDENIHHGMGITRAQTVKQIQTKQRIGQSFVADCFPGMNDEQIQKFCMDRLEKLDNTNYTNNDTYNIDEAVEFCQKHGLDEACKYIVSNFPNAEEKKKYLEKRLLSPICRYVEEGNLDMVKFFYEQGANFHDSSYYIVKLGARQNQLEVFKFLFSKFKDKIYSDKVGAKFVEETAEEGHMEVLEYLAENGYFARAIERSKKDNASYYDKKMAEMFARHKSMYVEIKKAEKKIKEKEDKEWKQKEAEKEKQKKQNLIAILGNPNKAIQNKIKNLPTRQLNELENLLSIPKKIQKKKVSVTEQTQEVAVLEKKALEPEKKVIIPDWFILGKMYRVKSKEWFNENKGENWWVEKDGVKFDDSGLCGKSFMLVDFCETLHGHHNDVEMYDPTNTKDKWNHKYIPMFVLEPDPGDHRNLSAEILKLEKEVKAHKFIYSARNATGAGRGRLREMDKVIIRAGYDRKGNECLQMPGGDTFCRLLWPIEKIRQLVKGEKITNSWMFTEHSGACDEVVIGNDKKKMPGDFEWESYGFG